MEQFSYNYAISSFIETWFDKLPLTFQYNLFKHVEHFSFINFSGAFIEYLQIVIQLEFWENVNLIIDYDTFMLDEVILL